MEISLPHFIISFFVGMFFVYITMPIPDVIFKYPTPINSGKIIYKDNSDTCYVYDAEEVSCQNSIETPLQVVNNKNKNNKGAITNLLEKWNPQ